MAPHLRVVLPAASLGALAGERALDLEGELRRAAARAAAGALDEDALEALACVACEALEGAGAQALEERLRAALEPVLSDVGAEEPVAAAVLEALLAAAVLDAAGATGEAPRAAKAPVAAPVPPAPPPKERLRWQRRGDAEAERAASYLRERNERLATEDREEDAHMERVARAFAPPPDADGDGRCDDHAAGGAGRVPGAGGAAKEEDDTSGSEDEVTLRDREATKNRLRQLGEVATYFGESDSARTARLTRLELSGDQDELAGGSTNVMQLIDRRRERQMPDVLASSTALAVAHGAAGVQPRSMQALAEAAGAPLDGDDPMGADSGDEAEEAADGATREVVLWLRSTLRDWEASLRTRGAAEGASEGADAKALAAQLRTERAQFRQSKQYLRPLRRKLKDGEIAHGIVSILSEIAGHCNKSHYNQAHEAYMRLAIGNHAWPMGCTQVTFHDRPNRHLIGEGNVAHVLDDETTRKYVQMVKRLISFSEENSAGARFKL